MSNNTNDRNIEFLLAQATAPTEADHTKARGLYCPNCGYDQSGSQDGVLVRCPECGETTHRADLLPQPLPGFWTQCVIAMLLAARAVIIAAFVFLVVPSMLNVLFSHGCTHCGRGTRSATQLRAVHQSLYVYAQVSGAYPTHVALLIPENYMTPEILEDPTLETNDSTVGDYDLQQYDWTPSETTKLTAAVASSAVGSTYYKAGDYWFVRLSQPTGDASIIAGWSQPHSDGARIVVFDDNHVQEAVGPKDWRLCCQADAQRRVALGLPAVTLPP